MKEAFLRIPPFPGHRARPITARDDGVRMTGSDASGLIEALRRYRVGGNFWAAQPALPRGRDLLLAPVCAEQREEMIAQAVSEGLIDRCFMKSR